MFCSRFGHIFQIYFSYALNQNYRRFTLLPLASIFPDPVLKQSGSCNGIVQIVLDRILKLLTWKRSTVGLAVFWLTQNFSANILQPIHFSIGYPLMKDEYYLLTWFSTVRTYSEWNKSLSDFHVRKSCTLCPAGNWIVWDLFKCLVLWMSFQKKN